MNKMKEKRSKLLAVNVTPEEYKLIRRAAFTNEKTISTFVREILLKALNKKEKVQNSSYL